MNGFQLEKAIGTQKTTNAQRFFSILEEKDTLIMQLKELKEKDEMLRKMIKGMQENGMSLDDIAKMLNKTVDEVKQIL